MAPLSSPAEMPMMESVSIWEHYVLCCATSLDIVQKHEHWAVWELTRFSTFIYFVWNWNIFPLITWHYLQLHLVVEILRFLVTVWCNGCVECCHGRTNSQTVSMYRIRKISKYMLYSNFLGTFLDSPSLVRVLVKWILWLIAVLIIQIHEWHSIVHEDLFSIWRQAR